MTRFEDYVFESVAGALGQLTVSEVDDVYAMSLWVNEEDDDPRRATFIVGFNTEARVRDVTSRAWDAAEARWNFAYWLQNSLAWVSHTREDESGAALRKEWIEQLGLWYSDEENDRHEPGVDERAGRIAEEFFALAVRVVQRLHAAGIVERSFGRPIPVVIHELEYYDEIAEYNRAANPPELVIDLVRWIEES